MTLYINHGINIGGGNVTDEEIKAYVEMIEEQPIIEVKKFMEVFPVLVNNIYNSDSSDVIMGKICKGLEENIRILKFLNADSGKDELKDEILELSKKLYVCKYYLEEEASLNKDTKLNGNSIVFIKTLFEKPYFNNDLAKVPSEVYSEVKKTLENIINGIDKSDNTKFKTYKNNDFPQKVGEFKGYQVRIFTTKLKDDILCVFGLTIKKDNNPKSVREFIKSRLSATSKEIDELREKAENSEYLESLLEDSANILNDIMTTLKGNKESSEEFVFPSDEELEALVPFEGKEVYSTVATERQFIVVYDKKTKKSEEVPETAKKVKRRTRGLGKKTIARREITDLLKGLDLEELLDVKAYIEDLRKNKELNEAFNMMYDGFLNMSSEQTADFESSIKNFKHDDVHMRK